MHRKLTALQWMPCQGVYAEIAAFTCNTCKTARIFICSFPSCPASRGSPSISAWKWLKAACRHYVDAYLGGSFNILSAKVVDSKRPFLQGM